MSANPEITLARITAFIASTLSRLEANQADDLALFNKETNPGLFDYDYCIRGLSVSHDRAHNQLQGVCLLFLNYPEIGKEIDAAIETAQQLHTTRFKEVQALREKQFLQQIHKPSPLALSAETIENLTEDTAVLETPPKSLPSVTPVMITALRYLADNYLKISVQGSRQKPTARTITALNRRGLIVNAGNNVLKPSSTGFSLIDIDDSSI